MAGARRAVRGTGARDAGRARSADESRGDGRDSGGRRVRIAEQPALERVRSTSEPGTSDELRTAADGALKVVHPCTCIGTSSAASGPLVDGCIPIARPTAALGYGGQTTHAATQIRPTHAVSQCPGL